MSWKRLGVWLVLLALPAALFGKACLTGSTFTYDDLQYYFYPWKAALYHFWGHPGLFPLWNPFEFSGIPLLADIQRELLYPLNLVFLFVPTAPAMAFFLTVHLALAAVFTYRWLRLLEVSRGGAAIGGMTFAYSGMVMLHASQLCVLAQCAWLPGGLLAIERVIQRPTRREALVAALYAAQALLAGSPQMLYISLWAWVPYLVWRSRDRRFRTHWRWLGLSAGVALMLALPQILACAELYGQAFRGGAQPYDFVSTRSLPPTRWWALLVPYAFGNPAVQVMPGYTFHEITPFFGIVPLLLALLTLCFRKVHPQRTLWVTLVIMSILFALGSNTPVHPWLSKWVPGFAWFRVPARWLLLSSCGVAALAGFGLDVLTGLAPRIALRMWIVLTLQAQLCLALLVILKLVGAATVEIAIGSGVVCAFWVAVSIMLFRFSLFEDDAPLMHRAATALLVVTVLADLSAFGGRYVRFTPDADVAGDLAVLGTIDRSPEAGRGLPTTSSDLSAMYGIWMPAYHLRNIQGSNPVILDPDLNFIFEAQSRTPMDSEHRLGMLEHDGFFIMRPDVDNEMLRMLDLRWAFRAQGANAVLDHLPGGYGPGWAVGATQVETAADQRHQLSHKLVDPRQVLLVEKPFPVTGPQQHFEWPRSLDCQMRYTRYEPDRIDYDVTMAEDGYVATSEIWYPGWKAWVDGQRVPVVPAYTVLRAFRVPRGHHQVVMEYRPYWMWTLYLSAAVLLTTLAALGDLRRKA